MIYDKLHENVIFLRSILRRKRRTMANCLNVFEEDNVSVAVIYKKTII